MFMMGMETAVVGRRVVVTVVDVDDVPQLPTNPRRQNPVAVAV